MQCNSVKKHHNAKQVVNQSQNRKRANQTTYQYKAKLQHQKLCATLVIRNYCPNGIGCGARADSGAAGTVTLCDCGAAGTVTLCDCGAAGTVTL